MATVVHEAATIGAWWRAPSDARILVVGAGGIGCELLKNLVMCGFYHIDVIDLDTIDVSNLNRQFLFHREHVGKSKAEVAVEAMRTLMRRQGRAHQCDYIMAHFGSVFDSKFDQSFIDSFDLVLNALDNKAARSHVNRLCAAAEKPLIESGTAGYLGQVTVIQKGVSECYDCQPKPAQRTYPGCTIRNTPSEPIHCIVWAKHLFNQLFGEPDIDEDVSPDMDDPELADGDAQQNGTVNGHGDEEGSESRNQQKKGESKQSVRTWAESIGYDVEALFNKLFHTDIEYLLKMDKLWTKRPKPVPLTYTHAKDLEDIPESSQLMRDQRVWSLKECTESFAASVTALKTRSRQDNILHWDKDDDVAMDFVVAVANVRAHVFHIARKSRFDIKSMAGNIIPAIATTNAIVAACIVSEAFKILRNGNVDTKSSRCVFFRRQPNPRGKILVDEEPPPQNARCIVCAKARVYVTLDTSRYTIRLFRDKVLKAALSMVAPDVNTADGRIIISSEEGELKELLDKTMAEVGVSGRFDELTADDFAQSLEIRVVVVHRTGVSTDDGADFELHSTPPKVDDDATSSALLGKRVHDEGSDESKAAKKSRVDE